MPIKRKLAESIIKWRYLIFVLAVVSAVLGGFSIRKTVINYDLNRYLSQDTMTQRALKVMKEEFGTSEQLRMMFSDLDEEKMSGVLEQLNALPEVLLASHDPASDVREADGQTWRLAVITLNDCDAVMLVKKLRTMFPDLPPYYTGGSAAAQLDIQSRVAAEIPQVMVISVIIVLLVLFLTSRAFLEPVIILFVLAISIIINMGTNFIFKDVSFITFSVCAILQLALSIDYAIMLLHTYDACFDEGRTAKEALTEALSECFTRITSSAITTAAGLLSLLFMSFTIGFDIGIVLSKGIMISMLTVFLVTPSVILFLQKPLQKTKHKGIRFGGEYLAGFIYRNRRPAAVLLIMVVAAGAWLNSQNIYSFTEQGGSSGSETDKINRIFGISNPLVLLVPGTDTDEDYEKQRNLSDQLAHLKKENGENTVDSIAAMVTTGKEALEYFTADDVAEMLGVPSPVVRYFFYTKGLEEEVRADRLLSLAGTFAGENEKIAQLTGQLETAKNAFQGPHYARMLLEINFFTYDPDFNENMDSILAAARDNYGEDFYITGVPMSSYDIGNAFKSDLMKVNMITFLAILLIVVISFRSWKLPILLVFVIEGAIWVTMGISRIRGDSIFFISYLICVAIQMGATIDYGILLCDLYRTRRLKGASVPEALTGALKKALPTILSSGIILITAGYIIGRRCSVFYISNIGLLISRGAFVSVVFVLTLLPSLLSLFDRYILKCISDQIRLPDKK